MTQTSAGLPPGQREAREFFRFGLPTFAYRFPRDADHVDIEVLGDVGQPLRVGSELQQLPRTEQISDFHCVTTWSCRNLRWSGYRFADFYREIVLPKAQPEADAGLVIFRGQDGYASTLPLSDLLAADVLLADQLDGEPLGLKHGAPLRLVAPAHYGYKNVKHIASIEFWRDARTFKFVGPYPSLMHHPRGRVALEERGKVLPASVLRAVYRLLVPATRWLFLRAQRHYQQSAAAYAGEPSQTERH